MRALLFLSLLSLALGEWSLSNKIGTGATLTMLSKIPLVLPGGEIVVNHTFVSTTPLGTKDITIGMADNSFGWIAGDSATQTVVVNANQPIYIPFLLVAPPAKVGVQFIQWTLEISGQGNLGIVSNTTIEVSCSNGLSCDGTELFVNGECEAALVPYCDYGSNCTRDDCDAELGICHVSLMYETCDQCNRNCDYLGCSGRQCGTDGCGGNCGQCASGTYCNTEGQCIDVASPGTCTNPIPLFEGSTNLTGQHYIYGNTSEGYHYHVIPCNVASTSPELVYTFTIPAGQTYGFDFRTSGHGQDFDTVLDVRFNSCDDTNGRYVGCNDDGTPPSNYGSRVARMIGPGKYLVVVKGYDDSQYGSFELYMSFQPECIPKCNSQFCGDDSCGGNCGVCGDGYECTENFKCELTNCVPNCDGNQCGFDGCGGRCSNGACPQGLLCNLDTTQCEAFPNCDGLNPVCAETCNETQYCASDCHCYALDAHLPDLFVERDRLAADIQFDQDIFKETSCAYREGCIAGTGVRRLLRFSVLTTNQGSAPAILPHPASRPDLFSYSPCHGHYHFVDYAFYGLLTNDGKAVIEQGRKQGYCVLDGSRRTNGSVDCLGTYTCDSQGISVGWADTYTYDLDCQWIDITEVPAGDYLLYVELNRARKIVESDYANNKAWVSVTIPPWTDAPTNGHGGSTTSHEADSGGSTTSEKGAASMTTLSVFLAALAAFLCIF